MPFGNGAARLWHHHLPRDEPLRRVAMLLTLTGADDDAIDRDMRAVAKLVISEFAEALRVLLPSAVHPKEIITPEFLGLVVDHGRVRAAVEQLTLAASSMVCEALALPLGRVSLAEQLVIDGFDAFCFADASVSNDQGGEGMTAGVVGGAAGGGGGGGARADALAVACGLHPALVAAAREQQQQQQGGAGGAQANVVSTFLLALLFPRSVESDQKDGGMSDSNKGDGVREGEGDSGSRQGCLSSGGSGGGGGEVEKGSPDILAQLYGRFCASSVDDASSSSDADDGGPTEQQQQQQNDSSDSQGKGDDIDKNECSKNSCPASMAPKAMRSEPQVQQPSLLPPEAALDDDGQVAFATLENVAELMLEAPERLPRSVVVARRKAITDPKITQFELERHYRADELRSLIHGMVSRSSSCAERAAGASDGGLNHKNEGAAGPPRLLSAPRKGATKKELVEYVLKNIAACSG